MTDSKREILKKRKPYKHLTDSKSEILKRKKKKDKKSKNKKKSIQTFDYFKTEFFKETSSYKHMI